MNIPQSLYNPKSVFIIAASIIGFTSGYTFCGTIPSFTLMADETQGQVVAIGDHYFTIHYKVEGQTFQSRSIFPNGAE